MFAKKTTEPEKRNLTAQEYINVEDITDDLIWGKDGNLFAFLRVQAPDIRLLADEEKERKVDMLTQAVAMAASGEEPLTILSIPRTVDVSGMVAYLSDLKNQTQDDGKLKLLNGEITSMQRMARQGIKEPMIVIKCWTKAKKGADELLKSRLKKLQNSLGEQGVQASVLNTQEIVYLCKVFADLGEYQPEEENVYEDIPLLKNQKRKATQNEESNHAAMIRNLITPIGGMEFRMNSCVVGSVAARIYGVVGYPNTLNYGWASDIMNASDSITAITYYPGSDSKLGDALSRDVKQNTNEAEIQTDARRKLRYKKKAEDAQALLEELDFRRSSMGHISIITMPFADDFDRLETVCEEVQRRFRQQKLRLRKLTNMQDRAFRELAPYTVPDGMIKNMVRQIVPLYTLMGGYPLTVKIYRDDHGVYFAETADGNIMAIDIWKRGGGRANSNIAVAGESGQGKSTAIKHLIMSAYMQGAKCIIIDPEREFKDLCRAMKGSWLDMGGGGTKINPLHVRQLPPDDETDHRYQGQNNALASHMHWLESFFHLYIPSISDAEMALLKKEIVALYQGSGISWDTDPKQLSSDRYPTMKDLYDQIAAKTDKQSRDMALLLNDIANGADSFLWNGHTNVDLSADFIVLDMNALVKAGKRIKQTQYYNMLSLCGQYAFQNRQERVVVVADEARTQLDPRCPQAAIQLADLAQRVRKYEGALITVVQSIDNFLQDGVREFGEVILDNSTYKILFGCDGTALEKTTAMYHLTKQEHTLLANRIRARALLLMGAQHIEVNFDLPQYKIDLMGNAGGR